MAQPSTTRPSLLSVVEIGLTFGRWNPALTVRQAYLFARYYVRAYEAQFDDLVQLISEMVDHPPTCPLKETIRFFEEELTAFAQK